MCTGVELFWLMAASTAVSAVSAIQQGKQEEKFAEFQAEQANADAQAEREAGQVRGDKIRKAGKYQQAEAAAALAASGVEVGAGTPIKIDQQIGRNVEQDALNEILFGTRTGTRLDQQAQGSRASGQNAASRGVQKAVGSVLSSGVSYYGRNWGSPSPEQAPAPVEDRTIRIR